MDPRAKASPSALKERFHEIDLLRGLACLMVVAFHYLHRGALEGWSPAIQISAIEQTAQYGYLGVHLFFIISGFVIFLSAHDASVSTFTASRISRLYPAFWVAVPLTWAVVHAFDAQALAVSGQHMLVNLTMFPQWFKVPFVDGAYWSLAVELQFYILVGLAIHFGLLKRKAELLLAGWLLIALANAIRPMFPVEFWLAANWAPLFCAGASAYLIRTQGPNMARWAIFGAAYLLALHDALKKFIHSGASSMGGIDPGIVAGLISIFFLIFALIALRKISLGEHAVISLAGRLTYPLYLVHEFMGYVFLTALDRAGVPLALNLALVFTGMGALAWLLNRTVETPLGPKLRRRVKQYLGAT